jgi:hypothetical protein
MEKELHLTGQRFNISVWIFNLGYLAAGIPLQIVFKKYGPKTLCVMMFCWGITGAHRLLRSPHEHMLTACSDRLWSRKAMGPARRLPVAGRHLRICVLIWECLLDWHVLLQTRVLDSLCLLLHIDNHRWSRQWIYLVPTCEDGWYCRIRSVEMVSTSCTRCRAVAKRMAGSSLSKAVSRSSLVWYLSRLSRRFPNTASSCRQT